MQHRLEIEDWAFWSPEGGTPAEWRAHWQRPEAVPTRAPIPDDAIPAAQRRRMSSLSKLAVQTAIQATRHAPPDFTVFCSQHGELVRTRELLRAIVAGEELSPAAFSQSVHNTGAGLYSIATQSRAPASSVASGPATFGYGWLEAEGYLVESTERRALLVCCEDPLPEEYRPFSAQLQCTYAVGLLLKLAIGAGIGLALESCDDADDVLPFAPSFLDWWLTAAPTLTLKANGQRWIWSRDGA